MATTGYADEGYDLYRRGAYGDVLRCLSGATRIDPDGTELHRLKGMALYRLGRYDDSLESFNEAVRAAGKRGKARNPESDEQIESASQISRMLYLRAKVRFRLGRTDEALDDLDANLWLDPDRREVLGLVLQEACRMEDGPGRCRPARAVPAGVPFCGRAACAPGHEIMLKGVLDATEASTRLLPSDAAARAALAQVLSLLSMHERALDEIDAAISLDPDVAGYHAARSGIHCDLGRMHECEDSADDALCLDPKHPQAAAWKGLCLYFGGYSGDGYDSVKSAYCRAPYDPVACLCMAYVLGCEGESTDALDVCAKAFRRFPHDGRLRLLLGVLLDEDADCR